MPRDNQDQLGWGNHDVVATGSNDGTKQVSVNAWNDSTDQAGLFGFVKQSGTISGNAIVPSGSVIEIQLDGTLNTLTPTNNNEFDLIYLIGKSGEDAITITHNASGGSGNIRLLGGASKTLSTTVPLILMARTIGANLEWLEYGGGATVDAGDLTGTTLASGVVTSSITTVGTVGSGTWQGTAVADSYVASASTWNAKQNALTFGIADGNAVDIDGSGTATGEYAKFTANGIIGEEVADVKTDLSLNNVENTALSTWAGTSNIVTTGTLSTGAISSGFGNIDNGSSTLDTGTIDCGAITTSGTLTMGDNIITGIKSLDTDIDTLAWNASTVVDFDTNEELILGELTGNIAFTSSNRAIGKHKVIHMDSDGSANAFTFPSGWVFYGTKPTTTTADKKSILSLSCIGSAEADVRAVFVEEA